MPEPETEGRRPRLREVVQEEGNQRLKRRKKKNRRRPFPETNRQMEPRRWRSQPSSQRGRSLPLIMNWTKGVQPTGLWGRGVPALQENLPKGSAWKHLSINQRIYTKLQIQLVKK